MAKSSSTTVKLTAGDRVFYVCVNAFLIFIGLIIAIPIIATITQSVTPNGYRSSTFDKIILKPFGLKDHTFNEAKLKDGTYVFNVENYGETTVNVVDGIGYTKAEIPESKQLTSENGKQKLKDNYYKATFTREDGKVKKIKLAIREEIDPESGHVVAVVKTGVIWDNAAYTALLGNDGFLNAFWNSLKIMIFGVITSLLLTIPMAYCMSIGSLPGRKILNYFVLIPYLFNIGVIPTYLVVTGLKLTNHLAAIFLPGAIATYNCLIMRGFFEGIPESLKESARIDGASEWYVLVSIILPLSKPIIMTIGLYYAVNFWNDFMHAMLYLNEAYLQPLPILLRNILMASGMNEYVEVSAFGSASVSAIKAASVFMSAIPMIIAYPFIQKYFTKGTMLGSVKG